MVRASDPFDILTPISKAKAANMFLGGLTGAQISSLSPKYDGMVVYCYSTGSGYTQGHWYGWDDTLGNWVDLNTVNYYNLQDLNQTVVVLDKRHATKEMYYPTSTGTGAQVINSTGLDRFNLDTGTTTTGVSMVQTGGPTLDFAQKVLFKVKIKTDGTAVTGQIVKIGFDIDKAGTGPATTNNFGIEYCDGNANWQIHSANGTTASNFDTQKAVAANTVYGFTIEYVPGTSVTMIFPDGTVKTKNTHIPSTGAGTTAVFKISISNNNGSAVSRTLQVLGAFAVYGVSDANWLQQ